MGVLGVFMSDSDRRVNERFFFQQPGISLLRVGPSLSFKVLNLSYGGFAVAAPDQNAISFLEGMNGKSVELEFLGSRIQARASFVNARGESCGFCFCHDDPKVLIFLRKFLEFMRRGASLVRIHQQNVQNKFADPSWVCLRGEGPTDLAIQNLDHVETLFFTSTFRDKMDYRQISWSKKNGVVASAQADFDMRGSPRMAPLSPKEFDAFRKCVCLLLGLSQVEEFQPKLNSLLPGLLEYLAENVSQEQPAHKSAS